MVYHSEHGGYLQSPPPLVFKVCSVIDYGKEMGWDRNRKERKGLNKPLGVLWEYIRYCALSEYSIIAWLG